MPRPSLPLPRAAAINLSHVAASATDPMAAVVQPTVPEGLCQQIQDSGFRSGERRRRSARTRRAWTLGGATLLAFLLIATHGPTGSWTATAGAQQPDGNEATDSPEGGPPPEAGPPPSPVRADVARLEEVQESRRVTGQIEARRRAIVASEEGGLVLEMAVDEGQFVSRGDLLARLDADLLELERAELEASVSEAQARIAEELANVARWEREVRSLEDLAARDAAQPKQLADARDDLAMARARYSVAEQAVNVAQAQVNRLVRRIRSTGIMAPFDGVVVVKRTEVGEWVNEGGPVVELIERGLADAVLDVPERIVNLIGRDMPVEITLATGEHFTGQVRAIVPEGDARARTYPVKVELRDPEGRLKPGMSLSAWLPTSERTEALTVPKDAIIESPTGSHVLVVRGPVAGIAPVEVITSAGNNRVVVSTAALQAGDQVIIEGNERLWPGAPVQVMNGSAPAAGGSPSG